MRSPANSTVPDIMMKPTNADTAGVRTLLRLEGLAVFAASLCMFIWLDASWWLFAITIILPDLAIAAYIWGPRIGALVYNFAHSYTAAIALAVAGHLTGEAVVLAGAVTWFAHIGFDRLLGYGLKLPTAFEDTHLGTIGRNKKQPA